MSQTPHCLFCWIRDGEVGWEPSSWLLLADFHCKVSSIYLPNFPAFDISLPHMYLVYTQLRDPVSLSPENTPQVFSWDRQERLPNYTKGKKWSQNLNQIFFYQNQNKIDFFANFLPFFFDGSWCWQSWVKDYFLTFPSAYTEFSFLSSAIFYHSSIDTLSGLSNVCAVIMSRCLENNFLTILLQSI